MPRFFIPAKRLRLERIIKKSRFIVTIEHIRNAEEARKFVVGVQNEFVDAAHNCWAWQAGPAGDSSIVGMSDDGEPHGTAGKPMLGILLHSEVGEIGAVVTRYFGGIKLGTGGLVRAYSGMVQFGLDNLEIKEKIVPVYLTFILEYAVVTFFKLILPEFEAKILQEDYAEKVSFQVVLPQEREKDFVQKVQNLTNGQCLIGKNKNNE